MTENKDNNKFYTQFKEERAAQNIDLSEISTKTNINTRYLTAIEEGNFEILPEVYVRLFIKAYAEFLNLDLLSILNEYDKYTHEHKKNSLIHEVLKKKPNKKEKTISIKDKEKIKDNENYSNNYFYEPSRLFSIFITFSVIFIIYFFLSYLSKEQTFINEDNTTTTKKISGNMELLSEYDFRKEKYIKNKIKKLRYNIKEDYKFQITTNAKTKIHLFEENEDKDKIEFCNIIAPKDTLIKIETKNIIHFDLMSPNDIQISIDNKSISKYLGKEQYLVRGFFNPKNAELHINYYSN